MGNVVQIGSKGLKHLTQVLEAVEKDLPNLDTLYVIAREKGGEFCTYVSAPDLSSVLACAQVATINSSALIGVSD